MTTAERMKIRRKELGMSAEYVAERLGCSPATIYRYEKGDIEKMPMNILDPLSSILDTTPAYLMGWAEEPISSNLPSNAIPYSPSDHLAPILGHIPAGYPVFAADDVEGYAPIDHADAESYFWLRVTGDSMINADIHDGDLVLIRQQKTADDGQIVAARVNGDEATLKRFRRSGDTVMLVPENPKYPPIPVPVSAFRTNEASIIGIVVELKRKFV